MFEREQTLHTYYIISSSQCPLRLVWQIMVPTGKIKKIKLRRSKYLAV
jgi:hypothetical protein